MVSVQEELVRPRVMTAVEDLVTRDASGVLEVSGSPSGAIYLDRGQIAYAQASWVPGLGPRLRAISPALAALAEPSGAQDADEAALAGFAVRGGYLTPARVHELIRSIVVDAFLVLTIPLAADSPVAAIRFTATRTYWTDMFPRLGIDLVRREACRQAERMAECGLAPTTTVAPRDLTGPAAVLTREQWAMTCQLGERASARDLALRRGTSLSDTVQGLGGLIRAGVCAPVRADGDGQHGGRGPERIAPDGGAPDPNAPAPVMSAPVMPDWIAPAPGAPTQPIPAVQSAPARIAQPVPRHPHPPTEQWLSPRRSAAGAWERLDRHVPASPGQPPSMDLLRQVLSGLRKLA